MSASNARPPLDLFMEWLNSRSRDDAPQELTPEGCNTIAAACRAMLPHLPGLILSGEWIDWTQNQPCAALADAARVFAQNFEDKPETHRADHNYDSRELAELDGNYYGGVLIGLALAGALTSTRQSR